MTDNTANVTNDTLIADDDTLARDHGATLTAIAAAAIRHGLEHGLDHGRPPAAITKPFAAALRVLRATFVTLEQEGELRGCIGTLEAHQTLADSVASQAYAAAFHDPRFAPVDQAVWPQLSAGISILSPCQPLAAASEAAALATLRPLIDGLVLTDRHHKAVFLPQVWEQLADPPSFLVQLKRKAGLAEDHWSPTLRLERFTVAKVPAARLAGFY